MKKILILLLLIALLLPLVSCGKNPEPTEPAATNAFVSPPYTETEKVELKCTVTPASLGGSVPIHTALQAAYLSDTVFSVNDYAEGREEFSQPDPVVLTWDVDFESGENELLYFVVRIWTQSAKSG